MYRVHIALARLELCRRRSFLALTLDILAASVERVFSNDAAEESPPYVGISKVEHSGEGNPVEHTFQGHRDTIVLAVRIPHCGQ